MQKFKQGLELWGLHLRQGGASGFLGTIDHANTANRTYTLPDKDGTFAMLSDIGASGVSSFNTRTGAITLSSSDVTDALGFTPSTNDHNHDLIYAKLSGAAFTDSIAINTTTFAATLTLGSVVNNDKMLQYASGGIIRWKVGVIGGSLANFVIAAYNDSQVFIDNVMYLNRAANGSIDFATTRQVNMGALSAISGTFSGSATFASSISASGIKTTGAVVAAGANACWMDAAGGGRVVTVGPNTTTLAEFGVDQYSSDLSVYRRALTIAANGSATFTGNVSAPSLILNTAGNSSIEIGRMDGVASVPYIDFHSGATPVDYDARIIASTGNGTPGGGRLDFDVATATFTGNVSASSLAVTNSLIDSSGIAISDGTAHERYARLSLTRSFTTGSRQYISLIKSGAYPWGIGMNTSGTLIFGQANAGVDSEFVVNKLELTTAGNLWVPGNLSSYGVVESLGGRSISINGGEGAIKLKSGAGGWAEGMFMQNQARTSDIGVFGFFGSGDTLAYHYIGGTYDSPLFKVDTSGNTTATGNLSSNQQMEAKGNGTAGGIVLRNPSGARYRLSVNASNQIQLDAI